MVKLAYKSEQWYVTDNTCKYKLIGPVEKKDAERFILLLDMVADIVDTIESGALEADFATDDSAAEGDISSYIDALERLQDECLTWSDQAGSLINHLNRPVKDSLVMGIVETPGLIPYEQQTTEVAN